MDCRNNLCLCISYDRVLPISTDVANAVCARFHTDGLVCPPQAFIGVFTTAAVDNIDHNPSSTSAHGFFHNAALSLLLQRPTRACPVIQRPATVVSENIQGRRSLLTHTSLMQCGQSYCAAHSDPMVSTACIAACPSKGWKLSGQLAWWHEGNLCKARVVRPRFCFMGCLLFMYTTTTFQSCDTIISVATFPHVAHSVAMIYHAMNVVKAVVTHLHPEQALVIFADRPMYSLAKKLQWNFPATHGEDKYVVFLGGMHVELTLDKCLGNWLEGSGWTTAVTNSGIASGGTANSFLKTSHLGRTKHVYQLTAAVLYILVDHAYVPYEGRVLTGWWSCRLHNMEEKTLRLTSICLLVLELGLSVINFLKAIHSGSFEDYIQSIRQPIPWIFSIDHMNYACSLTIQLGDMDCLASNCPNVHDHWEICCT